MVSTTSSNKQQATKHKDSVNAKSSSGTESDESDNSCAKIAAIRDKYKEREKCLGMGRQSRKNFGKKNSDISDTDSSNKNVKSCSLELIIKNLNSKKCNPNVIKRSPSAAKKQSTNKPSNKKHQQQSQTEQTIKNKNPNKNTEKTNTNNVLKSHKIKKTHKKQKQQTQTQSQSQSEEKNVKVKKSSSKNKKVSSGQKHGLFKLTRSGSVTKIVASPQKRKMSYKKVGKKNKNQSASQQQICSQNNHKLFKNNRINSKLIKKQQKTNKKQSCIQTPAQQTKKTPKSKTPNKMSYTIEYQSKNKKLDNHKQRPNSKQKYLTTDSSDKVGAIDKAKLKKISKVIRQKKNKQQKIIEKDRKLRIKSIERQKIIVKSLSKQKQKKSKRQTPKKKSKLLKLKA